MRFIDADAVATALPYPALIDALQQAFCDQITMPVRHHHTVPVPAEPDATLLLMPAWKEGGALGVKVATVAPGNGARNLPAVQSLYILTSATTGVPLAILDGGEITNRRTAAASALAARFLAAPDASHLLMVGTGRLAPHLIAAHASVRPLRHVTIWGRDPHKTSALAQQIAPLGLSVTTTDSLASAVQQADIISCATLSQTPLVCGSWLRPGQHLDLVGGFTPLMREADDECITRARVFVDTRAGACKEAGDITQPLHAGILSEADIAADLYELSQGHHAGRKNSAEITLFKSVGCALEDLAAAQLAYQSCAKTTF